MTVVINININLNNTYNIVTIYNIIYLPIMRKSIRRTRHRKKSVSDKYSRKSRITKTARNKNRSRNHKKSRKQMYVGGGCGASSAAGVRPKEVTDWWYQSDEPDCHGFYTWIQMGPNETIEMNGRYHDWEWIHHPISFEMYGGFKLKMMYSHDGEIGGMGRDVHIYFPDMEMTDTSTGFTRKIEKTTRYENRAPVSPDLITTAPFFKPTRPQMDAFGQLQPAPCASSPLTSATWYWESDDGQSWNAFTPDDSKFLESAYQNPMRQPIMHPTRPWRFDFTTMIQMNVRTESQRRIFRQVSHTPGTGALF